MLADPAGLDAAVTGLAALAPEAVDVVIGRRGARVPPRPGAGARARGGVRPGPQAGQAAGATVRAEYVLEYGVDALEIHTDAVASGARVLVHDDLLATGGTARTLCRLIEELAAWSSAATS